MRGIPEKPATAGSCEAQRGVRAVTGERALRIGRSAASAEVAVLVAVPVPSRMNYAGLLEAIDVASKELRSRAVALASTCLVARNWLVGAYLVEFEQRGSDRAKYGDRLLDRVAGDLRSFGLRGLDVRTLRDCRSVFRAYPQMRKAMASEVVAPALLQVLPSPHNVAVTVAVPARPIRGTSPELPTPLSPQSRSG